MNFDIKKCLENRKKKPSGKTKPPKKQRIKSILTTHKTPTTKNRDMESVKDDGGRVIYEALRGVGVEEAIKLVRVAGPARGKLIRATEIAKTYAIVNGLEWNPWWGVPGI